MAPEIHDQNRTGNMHTPDRGCISRNTVCILSSAWKSGSGWFTHELADAIAQAGGRVTLIAPPMLPVNREAVSENIDRRMTPRVSATDAGFVSRRWATLKRVVVSTWELLKVRRKAQVFLFNFVGPVGLELCFALLVRLWAGRLLLVIHDPMPHSWALPHWARALERWVYKLDYNLATHVICLSHSSMRVLEAEYNLCPKRVTVIPHGAFDLGEPSPLPKTGQVLIFGSIRPNKLVREAIIAVQQFRREGGQLRLLIAGGGGPVAYKAECLALAKQDHDGIKLDIRFIPEEEVASIIEQVDAVLLPYGQFNSQSGVAVLAGVSARPVIGSNAGGLSELFEMGLSGIRIEGDPTIETIVDALRRFQERSLDEWERVARAAREVLLQKLGWPAIGRSYMSVISKFGV